METNQNINIQEDNNLKRIFELLKRNYKLIIISLIITLLIAFLINRYSIPTYRVSSSILIKENQVQQRSSPDDFLASNIFGINENFQNELWIIKSYPIIEKTVRNLDLSVTYYDKGKFNYYERYPDAPFIISYVKDHPQPLDIKFDICLYGKDSLLIEAKSKKVAFYNFHTESYVYQKRKWHFIRAAKFGELIETPDLAFMVEPADTLRRLYDKNIKYAFALRRILALSNGIRSAMQFSLVDRLATVIKITLEIPSPDKGIDILNELMNVYSGQNLERKNHIAAITIDYIEKQLSEISDSLSTTEDDLQRFRSSRQLLNINDQAAGISAQYMDLQNQLAELVSRKRYFDYVSDLLKNDNYSNMMLPASIGISDHVLNTLMTELVTAQAQHSNLIANNQERNPLVQKLTIQIENLKKTISENISALSATTSLSMDEMEKRIRRIEAEINRLPVTQRQLGTIERKFRLNDAIYNYLMEKHAEAKITKASNLPDDVIIEPAKLESSSPVSPNTSRNYLVAIFLGLGLPFGYVLLKNALNNKIDSQDDIEQLTDCPVLGKILHNRYRTVNVMFEYPTSNLAESFRALRTNLDFYVRSDQIKVIMVTSSIEGEGKSFTALNLAMSYAQLGRKTILVDFDLRKPKTYFEDIKGSREGLTSYMIDKLELKNIILRSPQENFDFIRSGIVPPNPSELMALKKTHKLISQLKEAYDIIVLDTSPLAQVSDAYLLLDYADVKVLVARYNVTLKRVFSLIIRDLKLKNVNNICVVLNDNKLFTDQYGYGYGYYNKKKTGLGFLRNRKSHKEVTAKRIYKKAPFVQ